MRRSQKKKRKLIASTGMTDNRIKFRKKCPRRNLLVQPSVLSRMFCSAGVVNRRNRQESKTWRETFHVKSEGTCDKNLTFHDLWVPLLSSLHWQYSPLAFGVFHLSSLVWHGCPFYCSNPRLPLIFNCMSDSDIRCSMPPLCWDQHKTTTMLYMIKLYVCVFENRLNEHTQMLILLKTTTVLSLAEDFEAKTLYLRAACSVHRQLSLELSRHSQTDNQRRLSVAIFRQKGAMSFLECKTIKKRQMHACVGWHNVKVTSPTRLRTVSGRGKP